jgi:hypothetical protein
VQQETLDELLAWLAERREAWQQACDHGHAEVEQGQARLDAARNDLAERIARRDHARNMLRDIDSAIWLIAHSAGMGLVDAQRT